MSDINIIWHLVKYKVQFHNTANVQNTIKLYALKWLIWSYVNSTSILKNVLMLLEVISIPLKFTYEYLML